MILWVMCRSDRMQICIYNVASEAAWASAAAAAKSKMQWLESSHFNSRYWPQMRIKMAFKARPSEPWLDHGSERRRRGGT